MRGPGKGKTNNPNGRPAGSENRTTKESREFLNMVITSEFDNIKDALDKIRITDPAKYIDSLSKMMAYVLPRKTDVTTDDEKLPANQVTLTNDQMDRVIESLTPKNE